MQHAETPQPGRFPRTLGALAVMLLASSITEVKLGVPALCIRLGLQVGRSYLRACPFWSCKAFLEQPRLACCPRTKVQMACPYGRG